MVAPVIEGLQMCDEAERDKRITNANEAESRCRQLKAPGSAALNRVLDTLEPGGPKGQVQVGFTATLQLLGVYHRTAKGWEIDETQVDDFLRLVTQVRRPVVIYLAADHFDSFGPLTRELQKDPQNLMQLRDGKPLDLNYFGYPVIPYTLQTDASIPVNRYRYRALQYVAKKILALPREVQERIIAINLMGELHHMFPDFSNGMGAYKDIQVTDYNPASVAGFRAWLEKRHTSIVRFNALTGMAFTSFKEVPAPARNIRKEKLSNFGEHYDAFADGTLALSGWLWDPQQKIQQLDLYVDGRHIGPVPQGFNRLDVYRAVESITSPSVGFRYDFDYTALAPGWHYAQIVAKSAGIRYKLASVEFAVIARDQSKTSDSRAPTLASLPDVQKLPGVRAWLDLPQAKQDVYFNPVAREWNLYRQWQVQSLLTQFHNLALRAGLPADKLYSHQIMPRVNSSWNPQLFAADETLLGTMPWKQGINMYGGATNGPWMRDYLKQQQITGYGVPEFNPQQWKSKGVHLAAMKAQYEQGARFISPYYISLIPDRFRGREFAINRMELRPENKQDGADQFYRAIIEFAKR
ncbi:MAG: hypothetical protein ACK4OE_19370 [Acidovorax sp.]|uniref:hypothetical protein n=1 Tax=Acidovorax sp. TaxID=1872122 RepID=UPI00391CEE9C